MRNTLLLNNSSITSYISVLFPTRARARSHTHKQSCSHKQQLYTIQFGNCTRYFQDTAFFCTFSNLITVMLSQRALGFLNSDEISE